MAMTNAQIIFNERIELAKAGIIKYTGRKLRCGYIDDEGKQSIVEIDEPEELHTFSHWKEKGFVVKRGEHARAAFVIWKAAKGKKEESDEQPDAAAVERPRMFQKKAFFFTADQVQPLNAPPVQVVEVPAAIEKLLPVLWEGLQLPAVITPQAMETKPEEIAEPEQPQEPKPEARKNKYGVQVGDIFHQTWGYEQTNNSFFQVVELVGAASARVREVNPAIIEETATGPMSANYSYNITRDILPAANFSVFVKDQERGDLKRIKILEYCGDKRTIINMKEHNADLLQPGTHKFYCSWYA